MDGDDMGQWLSGLKAPKLQQVLSSTGSAEHPEKNPREFRGQLIYAGDDDAKIYNQRRVVQRLAASRGKPARRKSRRASG